MEIPAGGQRAFFRWKQEAGACDIDAAAGIGEKGRGNFSRDAVFCILQEIQKHKKYFIECGNTKTEKRTLQNRMRGAKTHGMRRPYSLRSRMPGALSSCRGEKVVSSVKNP